MTTHGRCALLLLLLLVRAGGVLTCHRDVRQGGVIGHALMSTAVSNNVGDRPADLLPSWLPDTACLIVAAPPPPPPPSKLHRYKMQ